MEDNRVKMVTHLVAHGAARADAQMMVDVAIHATSEAIEKVGQVTATIDGGQLSSTAYLLALRMLHANIETVLEELIPGFNRSKEI